MWSGVKLYYGNGDEKTYVGTVLGGNENYVSPSGERFRGLKLDCGWKDRSVIISGDYYIEAGDPALNSQEWKVYDY